MWTRIAADHVLIPGKIASAAILIPDHGGRNRTAVALGCKSEHAPLESGTPHCFARILRDGMFDRAGQSFRVIVVLLSEA